MPLRRLFERCLVRPEDLEPSQADLEVVGAFNPGVADLGDDVLLLVRVAEQPRERRPGLVGLPRYDTGRVVTDWVAETNVEFLDPRVVRISSTGALRLTFVSHLRLARLDQGREVHDVSAPALVPETDFETYGVEDPRITRIEGAWWLTYVAVSAHGACTALASTEDFGSFRRHGVVFCSENKDVLLFPERVRDRYVALHRPNPSTHFSSPEMWVATSTDLLQWGAHQVVKLPGSAWSNDRVGGGVPPYRVEGGWLEIYHGNRKAPGEEGVGAYSAGALLLDPDEPHRVIGRSEHALMVPTSDFERGGFVPNVVFPTGIADRGETLFLYYGAADTSVGVVEWSKAELLAAVQRA